MIGHGKRTGVPRGNDGIVMKRRTSKRFVEQEIKAFLSASSYDETFIPGKSRDVSRPKITVVTPSYNQAEFLERTILSVLNQNYPNLEYIVIDGGSTDGSVDIINKYAKYLTYWVSDKDRGQSDAINKGFSQATGDLAAWQNSDDIYFPGALERVARAYAKTPGIDIYFGNMYTIDRDDNILHELRYTPFSVYSLLYDGWNITNQSAFFRSGMVREYSFNEGYRYAMDGDFFVRAGRDKRTFKFIHAPLGALRIHAKAKGEMISGSVGVSEWAQIRHREGIEMREDLPWETQYRLRKAICKARKLFYYAIQGDIDYIVRRARGLLRG